MTKYQGQIDVVVSDSEGVSSTAVKRQKHAENKTSTWKSRLWFFEFKVSCITGMLTIYKAFWSFIKKRVTKWRYVDKSTPFVQITLVQMEAFKKGNMTWESVNMFALCQQQFYWFLFIFTLQYEQNCPKKKGNLP